MSATFDRYKEVHLNPSGAGDARPTGQQVIDDEGLRGAWRDKTILITGGGSGLGIETVRVLATTGATIFMTVRDITKGEAVRKSLLEENPALSSDNLILLQMDLASLASVKKAADEFKSKAKGLNILINNAGLAMPPKTMTADGFELSFQTNHLGHFLLFKLVEPLLRASSTPQFQSRVVNVSSLAHRISSVLLGDYNFEKSEYNPYTAYGHTKTANIWMANEIERRYGPQGIHGLSLYPGGVKTGLMNGHAPEVRARIESIAKTAEVQKIAKDLGQGTANTIVAAVCAHFEGKGGLYLEECTEATPVSPGTSMVVPGYATWAFDQNGERQLWEDSTKFVQSYL